MPNKTALSDEQAVEIAKKKKNRGSDWMKDLSAGSGEPGDNARFVRFALAAWDLPPIDISDPEQVKDRIGLYFKHCVENDRKPQIVGMCNWLGISRQALNEWKNGITRSTTHGDIVKRACAFIEEIWADLMLNGKINPASGIFLSKNWFDYKDVADVVVTPNNPLQNLDEEAARKRIIEALPEPDETD